MEAIVLLVEAGHQLEQGGKRRFRLGTDDPVLGHIDEHLVERQAQQLFAVLGNGLYPDVGKGSQNLPSLRKEKGPASTGPYPKGVRVLSRGG
jgi:hypothetical protein